MKKLLLFSFILVIVSSCQEPVKERHIEFHPNQDDDVKNTGRYLGTQLAIDAVLEFDKVWK